MRATETTRATERSDEIHLNDYVEWSIKPRRTATRTIELNKERRVRLNNNINNGHSEWLVQIEYLYQCEERMAKAREKERNASLKTTASTQKKKAKDARNHLRRKQFYGQSKFIPAIYRYYLLLQQQHKILFGNTFFSFHSHCVN